MKLLSALALLTIRALPWVRSILYCTMCVVLIVIVL